MIPPLRGRQEPTTAVGMTGYKFRALVSCFTTVPHTRRSHVCDGGDPPLRAGLTSGASPALRRVDKLK